MLTRARRELNLRDGRASCSRNHTHIQTHIHIHTAKEQAARRAAENTEAMYRQGAERAAAAAANS